MHTEETVSEELAKILGRTPGKLNPGDVADVLNKQEESKNLKLTVYGLFMWAVDKHGEKALYGNVLGNPGNIASYAEEARNIRDDFPVLLVNAGLYAEKLMATILDIGLCIEKLKIMSYPPILYVFFAGAGLKDYVEQFKKDFTEHMKRYPSSLDKLPESYRRVGGGL
jgi:hypothetical protein